MVREHKAVALLVLCLHLISIQSFISSALTHVFRPHGALGRSAGYSTLVRALATAEDSPRELFQHKLSSFMKTGKGNPSRKPLNVADNYIDIDYVAKMLEEMKQEKGPTPSAPVPKIKEPSKTQAEYHIEQRIKNLKGTKSDAAGSATALSNILSEMRDKAVWNQELISSVMLSIARLEPPKEHKASAQPAVRRLLDRSARVSQNVGPSVQNVLAGKQVAALKLYLRAVQDGCLAADREFLRKFVLALYLHNSPCRAHCVELLVPLHFLDPTSLLPGEVCRAIHQYGATKTAETHDAMIYALDSYYARIGEFSIHDTHLILRTLSRYQEVPHIFALLHGVRRSGSQRGTVETIELLSQALVKSVGKGVRAESMAELPRPERTVPEVVFVGRSNVGKSSLVNCLLNRKALASTSATPGHTRCFHFFPINQPAPAGPAPTGSTAGPSPTRVVRSKNNTGGTDGSEPNTLSKAPFMAYFVDVPGLGFAGNRSDSLTASWRGLLERYLHKRDPLSVVCHLVDARHGVTDVDREMITIAARAAEERASQGAPPFRYSIVITKTDKIVGKALSRMVQEIKGVVVDCMDTGDTVGCDDKGEGGVRKRSKKSRVDRKRLLDGVSVIPTSSVSREGAEKVWELIYERFVKQA